ncbi:Mitochondrial carrier [Nesidiocoris tenuis]|uniref:Mitochondrial carrier n=1 Tax=Nesidiocoris tenuis TaxID=355587 RepID=A0ABN7B5Y9_9HEMI|nr:Mitochondrial carrier [Nesidiocoris tenuis]
MPEVQSPPITLSTHGVRLMVFNVIGHPLDYVRFLIQIGHEPIPPNPATTLFGRTVLRLPSVLRYLDYIKQRDGWLGLYRGMVPKVMAHMVGSAAAVSVTQHFELTGGRSMMDDPALTERERYNYLILTLKKSVIERAVFITASQPLIVISARMMASFVGGEEAYSGFFSSIRQIFREDGILGFFSGLVPRLLGDITAAVVSTLVIYSLNNYVIKEKDVQTLTTTAVVYYVNSQAHPLTVVSSCMSVNNTGLQAGKPPNMRTFDSWVTCWRHLRINNQLHRGASLFFRPYNGPPCGR